MTAEHFGVGAALDEEWKRSQPALAERLLAARSDASAKGWRWQAEMLQNAGTFEAAGQPTGFGEAAAQVYDRFRIDPPPGGSEPERTADGRFVVIDGRRWRATDPEIPPGAAATLRHELMSARRAVGAALRAGDRDAERAARDRVQAAKVALGERGAPWWEQSAEQRRERWEAVVAELDA